MIFIILLATLASAKVFHLDARSKIDVSISGRPTTDGVDFTYEISNPNIGGGIYWMLTGPEKTSATVTAENVRKGVGAFHPSGCSGNAKQVDEQVHEVYLHCQLVQGDRYKIWLVKDEDYNGHNSHVVTPDGVPLLVPLPDPEVTLFVHQSTVSINGFTYDFTIKNPAPGGKYYWFVSENNRVYARDVKRGGACAGTGSQIDEIKHTVNVNCQLKPGVAYHLWFAVDFDGQGEGIFLSPKTGKRVVVPFNTSLNYSASQVGFSSFLMTYKLTHYVQGGKIYYLLIPQGQQCDAQRTMSGSGGVTSGSFFQTDDRKHDETVRDNFRASATYTLCMAFDTDGRGGNLALAGPGIPVQIPNQTQVVISVLPEKTTMHAFAFTYKFTDVYPGGKMYCSLTNPGLSISGGDVRDGKSAIWHASYPQIDENIHEIPVRIELEQAHTYLLWCAIDQDGTGSHMDLHKTNVVIVPSISCGRSIPNLPAHASATCVGNTNYLGDPCMAKCTTGYVGGPSKFICRENGKWQGSINCEAVDCGSFIPGLVRLNAILKSGTCEGKSIYGGTGCDVMCGDGFAGNPAHFVCGINGKWQGNIMCSSINCGPTIKNLDSHATANCKDTKFGGSRCTARCNTGYSGPATPYECSMSAQWVAVTSPIVCSAVLCPAVIPGLDHATSSCFAEESRIFGGKGCSVRCESGFDGKASINNPATFVCQANGQWAGKIACSAIDCGSVIPGLGVKNARATCNGRSTYQGSGCKATCMPGFSGSPALFTCGIDGKWQGEISCSAVDCGYMIPGLLHASANCIGVSGYRGPGCVAKCDKGFAGKENKFVCMANGQWSGSINCNPIDCGDTILGLDVNGVARCASTKYGGPPCKTSCAKGFDGAFKDYQCGADGKWAPVYSSLLCIPRDCGNVVTGYPHAHSEQCQSTGFMGKGCKLFCDEGYVGEPAMCTCAFEGEWRCNIQCKAIACPATLPGLDNANSNCHGRNRLGDRCEAVCNEGFMGSASNYLCGRDGHWMGSITCVPKMCDVQVRRMNAFGDCTDVNYYGSKGCMISCVEGYKGNPVKATCTNDSRWKGSPICTPLDCGPIPTAMLQNAKASCNGRTYYTGPRCQATCNEGYEGDPALFTCDISGKWTGNIQCSTIDCGFRIQNLDRYAVARCEKTAFGEICSASCRTGYKGQNSDYTCNIYGIWAAVSEPIMCSASDCGSLQAVLGPTAVVKTVTGTTYRSTGIAACKQGYSGGQSTFVCDADGTWHGQLQCDATNCGNQIIGLDSHAVAKCVGNTMFGGDACVASCIAGYEGGSSKYICTERGTWEGYLQCRKRQCDTVIPGLDPRAIVEVGGTLYGDKVMARCPDGYEGGPTTIICGIGGWEGSITCSARDCGPLGALLDTNAVSDCGDVNPFGGKSCSARCKEGYVGGPEHFICGPDGNWVGNIKCAVIDCGPFEAVLDQNANIVSFTGTGYKSQVSVACKSGYEGGQAEFYCGEDGHWHGALECKEPCPEKTMSVSVSHTVRDCAFDFTYEMSNYAEHGKIYFSAAEAGRKLSAEQVMQGGAGVCSGKFDQIDDLRHQALIHCGFKRSQAYTLYVAVDSDANGQNLELTHEIPMQMSFPDTVAVGISDVAAGSFTFTYQYDDSSFPRGSMGTATGKLYYAVTTTDIYGYNLPTDIRSGRSTIVFGDEDKVDAKPHHKRITVPLTPGKAYFLWVATDSSTNGQGLSLVTQNPLVLKVPDPTIANVRVRSASPTYVNFEYELNSYVPATGKLLYAISRDGMSLQAYDVKNGYHSLCYGEYDEGSDNKHSAHVSCDLASGNYLLWVATDECGGGCGLSLSTNQGVAFSVGEKASQTPLYNRAESRTSYSMSSSSGMNGDSSMSSGMNQNLGYKSYRQLGSAQKDTHESSAFVKDNQRNDALVAEISFVVGILMAMLVCGVIYYRRLQVSKQLNNRHSNPRDISLDSDVYILKEEETKGNENYI